MRRRLTLVEWLQERIETCTHLANAHDGVKRDEWVLEAEYLRQALEHVKPAAIKAEIEPLLKGRWHHGNGVLCCGTLRVASANFDTIADIAQQNEVLQNLCDLLNAAPGTRIRLPLNVELAIEQIEGFMAGVNPDIRSQFELILQWIREAERRS
jgi:hypothetical protein